MTGEAQGTTVQPPGSGQRWWRCRYCGDGRTFVGTVEQEAREATSHEASCPQRPAGPQPWTCPTPDLDLSNVEWQTVYVEPGTPYDDEPSEFIPSGWWVRGRYRGMDPLDPSPFNLHIGHTAFDEHGCDVTAEAAQYVAATLTLAADAERERRLPRRSRLRRAAKGVAAFIGEAIKR